MKKTIMLCTGNMILFTLLGLSFLFTFSEVRPYEFGLSGTITIFPLLLAAYLIIYPIAYHMLARKNKWKKKGNSELSYLDEREKDIVAESTKTAYKVLMGGLIGMISLLGGVRFYSLCTHIEISFYILSITLLVALLDITTMLYCIRWCLEYKK